MGVIIDGVYHSDKSPEDIKISKAISDIYLDNKITREAKTEAHNLIQPYDPAFKDYYPESAKAHGLIKEEESINNDEAK